MSELPNISALFREVGDETNKKNDKRNKKFLNTTFKTFFSNRRSQKIVCDNSFKGFLLNFLLN